MDRKKAHEIVKDIQNSFWKAYISIVNTNDIERFTADANKIMDRYQNEDDEEIRLFLNNTFLSWFGLALAIKNGHFDSREENQ